LEQILQNVDDPNAVFAYYPIYLGGNRGRGQLYPTGEKSKDLNSQYIAVSLKSSRRYSPPALEKNEHCLGAKVLGGGGSFLPRFGIFGYEGFRVHAVVNKISVFSGSHNTVKCAHNFESKDL
jgi:hypothetical protein